MASMANDRVRPTEKSPRGAFVATVKENSLICTDHYRLTLTLPRFRSSAPGQFVQIDCRDPHGGTADSQDVSGGGEHEAEPRMFEWGEGCTANGRPVIADPDFISPLAYLRRPFSIAEQRTWPDGYTEIDVIHRVVGRGTLLLKQLQPGQQVSLLGPLGIGFRVPDGLQLAIMVGGGVGIPPMIYLANLLSMLRVPQGVAFIGAQRHDLLPITFMKPEPGDEEVIIPESSPEGDPVKNVAEFGRYNFPSVITTDDGSLGMKGYVTQALRRFLEERQVQMGKITNTVVYVCGPTPMMKATAKVAEEFGVPCQVSLEQPMACGMGTCQSCVIKHRPLGSGPETDWKYKLTCTDGPVFDSREIIW